MKNKNLFQNTASKKGRIRIISPANPELSALSYFRIIVDSELSAIDCAHHGVEAGLICLSGEATITISGHEYLMKPYDTLFLPPGQRGTVRTESTLDIVEFTAPSEEQGPAHFVPFKEVNEDPELGRAACRERVGDV